MPTPFMERIQSGRTDLVFEYIASGGPPNAKDSDGVSLLQWTAYYGDVSAIRYLLSQGESLDTLGENYDLLGAAFHGHWRLVQYLLEQGADAGQPDPTTGETPLHAALCKRNRTSVDRVVQVLLASGADPNAPSKGGVPTACFMRDGRTRGETPLHRAAAFGREETISRLITAGGSVEAKDMNGETPLAWASWSLRSDSVLRLLLYGDHRIHPDRPRFPECGTDWGPLDEYLLGFPRF